MFRYLVLGILLTCSAAFAEVTFTYSPVAIRVIEEAGRGYLPAGFVAMPWNLSEEKAAAYVDSFFESILASKVWCGIDRRPRPGYDDFNTELCEKLRDRGCTYVEGETDRLVEKGNGWLGFYDLMLEIVDSCGFESRTIVVDR